MIPTGSHAPGVVRGLPMFPLATVLLPGSLLPLRLFEDRYLRMVEDLLDGDREFGVVLIRRGHEVGGGEECYEVGTRARILEANRVPDGRWSVVALGLQRLRVEAWLPDHPYPVADVRAWPDDRHGGPPAGAIDDLRRRVARLLDGHRRLGDPVPSADSVDGWALADDPALATFQLAGQAPLGTFDRQRLLEAQTAAGRAAQLSRLVDEAREVVELRLAEGQGA